MYSVSNDSYDIVNGEQYRVRYYSTNFQKSSVFNLSRILTALFRFAPCKMSRSITRHCNLNFSNDVSSLCCLISTRFPPSCTDDTHMPFDWRHHIWEEVSRPFYVARKRRASERGDIWMENANQLIKVKHFWACIALSSVSPPSQNSV